MIIIIFIFGLIIGSFLNAVIWRLYTGESFLKGRSYCPKCRHQLSFLDLVPVFSFLFQKGRCRYCQKRISWQYPLVELATAILFSLAFLQDSNIFFLLRNCFFIAVLVIIFVYDLKYYLILDKLTLPAVVIAFILQLFGQPIYQFSNFLLAGAVGGGFFLLQYLISRGRWIGGGDIRLGVLMGIMLGWPQVLVALFFAYIIGALISVLLIISGRKKWSGKVPFGTFLSIAAVITLFWGDKIVSWYLAFVS